MVISLLLTAQGVWTSNQQLFFAFLFNLTVNKQFLIVKFRCFANCTGLLFFKHFIVSYNAFKLVLLYKNNISGIFPSIW